MRERTHLQSALESFAALERELDDAKALIELADEADDDAARDEAGQALADLRERVAKKQLESLLSGEAEDWAEMLMRMYLRWAEDHGFKVEWLEESPGEEAGLKSATVRISGPNAYGWLKTESGVHRLVRISPFDSQARRHTSFASVSVFPVIDDTIEIDILDKDIRVDTYRASGAGGQHVNKTDSAVRITHLPTGIVVQCQNDRSQHRNRAAAFAMLRARLYEAELQRREREAQAQHGEKTEIGWGHQIRSYVLHPYQMVKDLRTQVETGNTQAVLDGRIDMFLEAALSSRIKGGPRANDAASART
jgi:peptide chain release factor 2